MTSREFPTARPSGSCIGFKTEPPQTPGCESMPGWESATSRATSVEFLVLAHEMSCGGEFESLNDVFDYY